MKTHINTITVTVDIDNLLKSVYAESAWLKASNMINGTDSPLLNPDRRAMAMMLLGKAYADLVACLNAYITSHNTPATDGMLQLTLRYASRRNSDPTMGLSTMVEQTLINRILPDVNLRTAEISDTHNTGMHTTTFSEMLELPQGGYIIDTPGIKGFGTFNMEPEEITSYFKEIFKFSKDCRFNNCTHTHEPGCAVLKAVEDHYIAASRYQSYLSMLNDKDENKYREAY